jgi:hypothetical protein
MFALAIAFVIVMGLVLALYLPDDTLNGLFLCTPPHAMCPEACEAAVDLFIGKQPDPVVHDAAEASAAHVIPSNQVLPPVKIACAEQTQ